MNTSFDTLFMFMASSGLILGIINLYLHQGIKKLEQKVTETLPRPIAVDVNKILDGLERIAEIAVLDANNRVVLGLKAQNLFTSQVQASIKASVIADVLANLGPLKDQAVALLGPIEDLVGQMVERYVLKHKQGGN